MKIYVASSWRNTIQPEVVKALRLAGHDVYDFKNPEEGDNGFHWSQVWEKFDGDWRNGTNEQFIEALKDPIAEEGFQKDMKALNRADATVLVMPCGRSAHLELGYAVGVTQHTAILLSDGEPELMYKMVDKIATTVDEIIVWLEGLNG